jgi:hypothetical protein
MELSSPLSFVFFSFSASLLVEQPVAVLAMHWGWGPLITIILALVHGVDLILIRLVFFGLTLAQWHDAITIILNIYTRVIVHFTDPSYRQMHMRQMREQDRWTLAGEQLELSKENCLR